MKYIFTLSLIITFSFGGDYIKYLTNECNNKDYISCSTLAEKYESGDDKYNIKSDRSKSLIYLKKACDNGGTYYCYEVWNKHHDTFGAVEYLKKSCDGDLTIGCSMLGQAYEIGWGVEKDVFKAVEYYQKACDMKDGFHNCSTLGKMYEDGIGVRQDVFKASEFYTKACYRGFSYGCYNLGRMYFIGNRYDKQMALKYFGMACDMKNQEGCEMYSKLQNFR